MADSDAPPICWLLGYAGYGKTAIARSLAHLCAARPPDSPGSLAATFFFHRDDMPRRRIRHVVPTLVRQLSVAVPELVPILQAIVQRDPSIVKSVFEDQIQRLILEPLRDLPPSKTPLLILFDALDECDDAKAILHLISLLVDPNSNPHLPLRVFVTSRPEPAIRKLFDAIQLPIYTLNLQDFSSNDDIRLFLASSLQDIRRSRWTVMVDLPPLWPSDNDLDGLVAVASGMFIFATTAATFIGDRRRIPQEQLITVLRIRGHGDSQWEHGEHAALDRLYKQTLSSSPNKPELLLVLSAIMFLEIPLSPRQLGHLLGLPLDRVQLALEGLHSILSIPDDPDQGPVFPLHLSFNDFLTSHHRAGEYAIDAQSAHTALSRACLALISQDIPRYRPIFQSQNTSSPSSMIQKIALLVQHPNDAKTVAIRYACNHFTTHLVHSMDGNISLRSDLSRFCRDQVIPWQIYLAMDTRSIEAGRPKFSSFDTILFSMKQFLGPLCLLAWTITSIVLPFIYLDVGRKSTTIDHAIIAASTVELLVMTAHLPWAVCLTSLMVLAYRSSTMTFHLYAWWAPMYAVFVAARLRWTWRPLAAIVLLWGSAVLSSNIPGTSGLRLEHQVALVTILLGLMVEYQQGWREWCLALCSLTMGHLATIVLSLAGSALKIGVTLTSALSFAMSLTGSFVRLLLLLSITGYQRQHADMVWLMTNTPIILVLAHWDGVMWACALSLGLSFPWMWILDFDAFWSTFLYSSWLVMFLVFGPFLGVSGCLITGVVAGLRGEQLRHRMGIGRGFQQQKGRLSKLGYGRELPAGTYTSVIIWINCLMVVLEGVVWVIMRVVDEVNMEHIQMTLGYVVPPLAAAVYLGDLWVFWKPRCGYMNVCGSDTMSLRVH